MAADYEMSENRNVGGARILLQRGLRLNPEKEKLWIEYFKLEVLWIIRLIEQEGILAEEKQDELAENSEFIKLDELDQEKRLEKSDSILDEIKDSEVVMSKLVATVKDFLVPRAIYRNAIKGIMH
jgi:U3 small nucleolar RNA-associated protein 6